MCNDRSCSPIDTYTTRIPAFCLWDPGPQAHEHIAELSPLCFPVLLQVVVVLDYALPAGNEGLGE